MSLLSSLFQSKSIQDAAFGAVKKMMVEGNYKYFLIEIDKDGELTLNTYTHEQQPVMMAKEQMNAIEVAMESLSKASEELESQIDGHLSEQTKLVEICQEQERQINNLNAAISAYLHEIEHLKNPTTDGSNITEA